MNWKRSGLTAFAASLLILTAQVHATLMLHMDLGELTNRADRIFRGTLVTMEQITVEAGGAELPAVRYQFRVEELFKGEATETRGDQSMIEIRIIGNIATEKPVQSGVVNFDKLRDVPRFDIGGDYVLFSTPESSAGLSVTVGLGQGAFKVTPIDGADGEYQAVNEYNNVGLDLNGPGPVHYDTLSANIRALLGQ